jgi:hypothetical protein
MSPGHRWTVRGTVHLSMVEAPRKARWRLPLAESPGQFQNCPPDPFERPREPRPQKKPVSSRRRPRKNYFRCPIFRGKGRASAAAPLYAVLPEPLAWVHDAHVQRSSFVP